MGTKNTFENLVTSINSPDASTFSSSTHRGGSGSDNNSNTTTAIVGNQNQLINVLSCGRVTNVAHPAATASPHNVATKLPSPQSATTTAIKHRMPVHVSRTPPAGNNVGGLSSIGVSVITPAVNAQNAQKEAAFAAKHHTVQSLYQNSVQQPNLIGFGRNNVYTGPSASTKMVGNLQMSPGNNASAKSKLSNSISTPNTAFVPHSPYTQHMPKFLSSSKHLVNTDDYYLNDDGTITDIVDKRAQYCSRFPPGYQHVLQDHSYSQLPESPPPPITPPTPPQRSTINGLNRLPASSVGPTKVTLNNRLVNVGGVTHSGGRLSAQLSLPPSINCGGYPSNLVDDALGIGGYQNNGASVIAVNPRKGAQSYPSSLSLAQFSKSVLRAGMLSDKPEESDLSEDDRLPDPHGEETETAPEAEGDEESVTRCVCDFEHDDGYMIQCDKCSVWQHVVCMGIDWRRIPDEYQCEKCQPRFIDKRKAIEIQKRKLVGKLCVGANDESDSSDAPPTNSKNKKNQPAKRKYKQRRTGGGNGPASATATTKRKNAAKSDSKESATKPRKNAQMKKRPAGGNDSSGNPLASGGGAHSNMTPERKKQLLIERKQMLEKKQMTKKRSIRKQAQNTKRNSEKNKQLDNDIEYKFGGPYVDRMDSVSGGAGEHPIQKVRDWVDRYEEAVTNHYSQELRARLSAVQVNGVHSDLKFTATLKSVEKCRTSLLSTGGKILLSTTSLSSNQAIIELRGKYMWTGASSFKQHNISPTSPYVFYYRLPKHDIEICVDCRTYGNFARFVRRSCKPNAELRHCVRKTSLHLYLIATQPLKKNSEILIGHYSPDTANTCVCGSPENCTAAETRYPSSATAVSALTSKHYGDKLAKESQNVRSASPLLSDSNSKSRKTPANADKTKKKIVEEKKKLTKEKRRGRRKSPSRSNSDRESSSRDQSPSAPTKLTVNMWSKGSLGSSSSAAAASTTVATTETNRKTEEKTIENGAAHAAKETCSPKVRGGDDDDAETANRPTNASADEKAGGAAEIAKTESNWSSAAKSNAIERTNSTSGTTTPTTTATETTQTPKKGSRQTDYARKEKQQLDYPLFFQTPNNHKMTREEKKIQAIMKAFEQLEKTEARKQENQKHRRESTSDAVDGKKMANRKNATTRSRKNTEESRDDEQPSSRGRKDSVKDEPMDDDDENDDDDAATGRNDKAKVTNGEVRVKREQSEATADDEDTDDEDDDSDGGGGLSSPPPASNSKRNCKRGETPRRGGARARVTKATRQVRCMPKARATAKTKIARNRKRKSGGSDPENEDDGEDVLDVGGRSSVGAILRSRNAQYGIEMHRRNSQASPLGKLRRTDDPTLSPYSTPPKMRERLDSSSSSGGTPPTPVSDTCLLVAAAVGHLTDFKFPNTKKELMNAWFKEERKPSPDEENTGKQEGNNECAKKRWLRQAISEEGDSAVLRPEESVSPNGDYGGPLKKRRFARESMSEHTDESVLNALVNANQMSFDEDDDVSSPDASQFRTGELDNVTSYQRVIPTPDSSAIRTATTSEEATIEGQSLPPLPPTAPPPPPPPPPPPSSTPPPSPQSVERATPTATPPPSNSENTTQKTSSPTIAKKKLSLTEYQKRKNVSSVSTVTTSSSENATPVASSNQEATVTTPTATNALPNSETASSVEREKRSPSRSSVTSSSASEDEDDDSHAASAQVIARSLMIESRHLMYGPQASALVNSLRSSSISSTSNSAAFGGAKSTTPNQSAAADIPRENLADRLKREFNVHVTEDDGNTPKGVPPVSALKTLIPMPSEMVRMKKPPLVAPSPSPHSMPNMGLSGTSPYLPPLPDAPQLFAPPAYFSYPIAGVPPPFFAAPPPPPPPPLPVPPPSVTTSLAPPPPPPPQ